MEYLRGAASISQGTTIKYLVDPKTGPRNNFTKGYYTSAGHEFC
jgi:hypothetical protein